MIVTYKEFELINFPIFVLPSDNLDVRDGLLFCDNTVVDDRNQIGDTIGKRRIQTSHPLMRLRYCIEDIPALIRTRKRIFVDNKGYCFIYERTKFTDIKFHKILKVIPKDIVTILKVSNVNFPVIVKRPPPPGKDWVGMVYLENLPWIPYEYSEHNCDSFKRKI